MRVTLQLSIEPTLKERLAKISRESGVAMSKVVSDLLVIHLPEVEQRYVQLFQLKSQDSTTEPLVERTNSSR